MNAKGLLLVLLGFSTWASGSEALFVAARQNDEAMLIDVIMSERHAGPVNPPGSGGATPLHVAAACNATNVVAALLRLGAERDARTELGYTPLHWAAIRNAEGAARLLLEKGADPNAATLSRVTPLHCAVRNNALAMVSLLFEHGARGDAQTTEGVTPLMMGRRNRRFNEAARHLALLMAARGVGESPASVNRPDEEPDTQ